MKLTEIYISAFGLLEDYTIKLSDGFSCIYGENENGKTTIMSFIKMMFYGSGRASRTLSENPRKHYKPWSGKIMGGKIYFEHNCTHYCLEREFRGSDSTDRVILRNLDLGTGESVESNIGQRFFAVGDAAFARSVFIAQPSFSTDDAASGEIGARLSNLASTGEDGVSYNLIRKRISDALTELKTPRKVGKYDKGLAELQELEESFKEAMLASGHRIELTEKIKTLSGDIERAQQEYNAAEKLAERENNIRLASQLREFLSAKAQLDKSYSEITLPNGTRADESYIKKIDFCINRCRIEAEQRKLLEREAEKLENCIAVSENTDKTNNSARAEELTQELNKLSEKQRELKTRISAASAELENAELYAKNTARLRKKIYAPLLLFSAAAVVLAAVLLIIDFRLPSAAFAVFAVISAISSVIFKAADRKKQLNAEADTVNARANKSALEAEIAEVLNSSGAYTAELNLISSALNIDAARLEQKKSELREKTAELKRIKEHESAVCSELFSLTEGFCDSHDLSEISDARDILAERAKKVDLQKAALNSLAKLLGNISYKEAEERLAEISAESDITDEQLLSAKSKLPVLNERIIDLNGERREAALELKRLLENAIEPNSISKDISKLKQTLQEQENFCSAAELSIQVLDESYAELRRGYGAALEKAALRIFSGITNGKYKSLSISKALEMEAEAENIFGSYSIAYLSSGTIDQAYLSLRLAAAELISSDPLPVFLDDSLAQFDDARTERAIGFLKEYSAGKQLILFTCHNSVYTLAKKIGAECGKI